MLLSLTVSANSYDEFKAKIAKAHDDICNTISQQTSLMDFSRQTTPLFNGPTCSDTASEVPAPALPPVGKSPVASALETLNTMPFMSSAPAASSPVGNASEVDVKGMPHLLEIHSANKSKNLDGSWRYKRGVDDATIAAIESQYKGATPAPAPVAPPILPPAVTLPPLAQPVAPPQVFAPVVVAPPVEVAAPAPTPMASITPAHTLATFKNNLTELLAQFINEGKINQEYIASLCAYFEVKDIWNVLASEKKCIELYESFIKAGLITEVQG